MTVSDERSDMSGAPVGIICGGGMLPFAVADAVAKRGRRAVLFALRGTADPGRVEAYPHYWIALGQTDRFIRLAKAAGCRDIVFIGSMVRPSLWQIRLDFGTVLLLPKIIAAFRGGDDHLLSTMARVVESFGFRLLGAHEVAPDILIPEGTLTRCAPSDRDRADITRGLELLDAIGAFDVGQATVVAANHILAVEGVEGTDGMLSHLTEMQRIGRTHVPKRTGVLIKAAKPKQDRRFDLPAIGPVTVDAAVKAGLAGIAVIAGETLIADLEQTLAAADRAGIFIVGIQGAP